MTRRSVVIRGIIGGVVSRMEGSCVLYCARTVRVKTLKDPKFQKNPKKISKKVAKIPNHPFGHPTQPSEDGAVEETDGREYFAFCVWIRFRVVNGGMNDGTMDGTME